MQTARTSTSPDVWVTTQAHLAGRFLAPVWPIENFIAVNPLGGFEDRPFSQALSRAGELLGARGTMPESWFLSQHADGRITDQDLKSAISRRGAVRGDLLELGGHALSDTQLLLLDLHHGKPVPPPVRKPATISELHAPDVASTIDSLTTKWCAAFLDEGQASWKMPGRDAGFYPAWRRLAWRDPTVPSPARRTLRELAMTPAQAAASALEQLGVSRADTRRYMQAHLSALPGWAGHVLWRSEHAGDFDLLSYLAMRLCYEQALLAERSAAEPPAGRTTGAGPLAEQPSNSYERALQVAQLLGSSGQTTVAQLSQAAAVLERIPAAERSLVWLEAYESHYRNQIIGQLSGAPPATPRQRPAAQLVCCIDPRSEGLRRHLEAVGRYETLGFAGFFAVAIRYRDLAGGAASDLCPVLIEPSNEIDEVPKPGAEQLAARTLAGASALAGAQESFHIAKDGALSPFTLAEASGWLAAPLSAARTLAPSGYDRLRRRLQQVAAPDVPTRVTIEQGFSFQERALFAQVALVTMGLTEGFAPLVVLCGHGSSTENNPYAAALDCGACGGNRGAPNARVAAAILNGSDVREHLRTLGISVPDDTWFLAAEHDTATDTVTLLDVDGLPAQHQPAVAQLQADLRVAGARLSAERCLTFPGGPRRLDPDRAAAHVRQRSSDWSQVFPEWGLAGNALFIAAPRSVTYGQDLQRRVFLHSYEAAADPDGAALETILTAPMVVAQWINCQYYFSTVDQERFGSGTKTIHNVVGRIGLLSGHNGDLQVGLPWQSLADGQRLIHEPMRLLALVQAPLARIDAVIARNTVLQNLFGNDWVALAAREREQDTWQRLTTGGWTPWAESEAQ